MLTAPPAPARIPQNFDTQPQCSCSDAILVTCKFLYPRRYVSVSPPQLGVPKGSASPGPARSRWQETRSTPRRPCLGKL